jgi:Putative peptidoglycan binding domain
LKMRWERAAGWKFITVSFFSILLFLGCAGTRQPVSKAVPPKPETFEVVSEVPKTDRVMVPSAPAVPAPLPSHPEPRAPEPQPGAEETSQNPFRKGGAPGPPVDPSDPIANGSVFLNPSDPQDVQTIQGRLAELGFYSGGIDGIWGKESREALRAFKEKNSLPHPESWDRQTQMFLFRQVNR